MKKLLVILFLLILAFSCKQEVNNVEKNNSENSVDSQGSSDNDSKDDGQAPVVPTGRVEQKNLNLTLGETVNLKHVVEDYV